MTVELPAAAAPLPVQFLTVKFDPKQPGAVSRTLRIRTDLEGGIATLPVEGEGVKKIGQRRGEVVSCSRTIRHHLATPAPRLVYNHLTPSSLRAHIMPGPEPPRRTKPASTSASTPTTRWTGTRGGRRRSRRAKELDRPIFLSIGYSACHWCHVMEHESFEDEATAKVLNEHFVCIKVDREERPDLDTIYMNALQVLTREGGGWPLSVFLTPDLTPFYAGTYYPPDDRYAPHRPSFKQAPRGHRRRLDEPPRPHPRGRPERRGVPPAA